MEEIWKDILEYVGLYQVSNFGNVRSLDHYTTSVRHTIFSKGRVLKPFPDGMGYLKVKLSRSRKDQKTLKVHRLVAMAFIPNPENKATVNHIDANKINNKLENLEWATSSENNRHAINLGLRKSSFKNGSLNNQAKLTEDQVRKIKVLLKQGNLNQIEISKLYNVSNSTISLINRNRFWKHV